jgi:GNAT superfamily N-acetyltransferase
VSGSEPILAPDHAGGVEPTQGEKLTFTSSLRNVTRRPAVGEGAMGNESEVADLEAVERDACADVWAAVPGPVRDAYGVGHRRVGEGVLLAVPGLDSILFNRLLGYGLSGPRAAELDAAVAELRGSGVRNWCVQVPPTAARLAAMAAARGLVPHPRAWVKFVHGAEPAPAPRTAMAVREASVAEAASFGAVACAGFGLPPALAPWLAALVGRPGWRVFIAWDGPEPVGTGALWIGDRLGWLGFATTRADHRGRGVQGALIAARIEAGRQAGLAGFTTETGVPLPGEGAPSFRNIERSGFRQAYRRENLRPAG